jgi:hypothetical protein
VFEDQNFRKDWAGCDQLIGRTTNVRCPEIVEIKKLLRN